MTDFTKWTPPKALEDEYMAGAQQRIDSKVLQMVESGYRQDTIAFTKGQLEALESTIYDVIYGNPMEAFQFVPINTSSGAAAQVYSYRMVEKTGEAKIVADGAHDRNVIDSTLTKSTLNFYEFGGSYTYTIGDTQAAGMLDFDQVQFNARQTAEAIARAHNEYCLVGGAGVDGGYATVKGFYNNGDVNDATLTDADWTTVTAAAAYTTVTDVIHTVITQSSAKHRPTDVLLSTFVWNFCASNIHNSTTGATVLKSLRENYPDITFHLAPSATARGTSGVDICVAYEKRADRVEYIASVIYDEAAADKKGFNFIVEARGRTAGTAVRYPLSMAYGQITIA